MENTTWIIANHDSGEWIKSFSVEGLGGSGNNNVVDTSNTTEALRVNQWFIASTIANLIGEFHGLYCTPYPYETHCSEEEENNDCPF